MRQAGKRSDNGNASRICYTGIPLRAFWRLTTLEEGLRPAAERLHTTPPNLCKQAQKFQERFQLHLYRKRLDNRITPTKTGTAFIAIARGVLEARD